MPKGNLLDIIGNLIFNWPNVIQPFLFKRGYVVWVFVLEKLALCERTPPPLILTSAPPTDGLIQESISGPSGFTVYTYNRAN